MERSEEIEITVVRHGQTYDNIKNLCQGHTDGKLTELGITQAKVLGERLAKSTFDVCYVSDLGRTRETHSCIMEVSGPGKEKPRIVYTHLMREKGGGIFEGQPLKMITDAAKKANIPIRDFRPEKGECWKDVHKRASDLLRLVYFERFVQGKSSKMC